jgi:hypothetical protein
MNSLIRPLTSIALVAVVGAVGHAYADNPRQVFGARLSAGGRFDNVRKCVASPTGTRGGPAADISAFLELPLRPQLALLINLPVFRPVLFGIAFKMLQFEPDVTLVFRRGISDRLDLVFGPSLGISLHYGPDYLSESSGPGRTPSFFALGPMFGGYLGLDFKRPGRDLNWQLGVRPYVTPIFGVDDPASHRGVVVGGMLEVQLRFARR